MENSLGVERRSRSLEGRSKGQMTYFQHDIIVTEIDIWHGCEHLRHHRFVVGDYRSIVSYSAFFHSLKERCYYPSRKKSHILYHGQSFRDYELAHRTNEDLGLPPLPAIPTSEHEDIWAFYKYIGWNWKRKRYDR